MSVELPVKGATYRLRLEPGCRGEWMCHGVMPSLNGQRVIYHGLVKNPTDDVHNHMVTLADDPIPYPQYVMASELEEITVARSEGS